MTNLLCTAAILLTFIFVIICSCYVFNETLQYEEVLKTKEDYHEKNVYLSFDSFVKFYSVAKDKYKINGSYKGYYFSREIVGEEKFYGVGYTTVYTYNYFMDSFSDHVKYQKFCEEIYKAKEEQELKDKQERKEKHKEENLKKYLEVVKADIAENEEQINKKIQELKDELQKQKDMIGE